MPRRFYKDAYGPVDPSLVGFSNKLAEIDLEQPAYTHRNPITGELCACNYGTPKQQPETKVAAERPDPTVWLVTRDEVLANSLERYLGDQFNFVVIPLPNVGRVRKDAVPGFNPGFDGPDLIVTTRQRHLTFEPELEEILAGKVPILSLIPDKVEALKHPDDEDSLADWQMAFGEEMTDAIVNAQEDYTPDLKTDVGRQIYKQNQKMFRVNGPLTKETGDKNAGPKALEFLDNLVHDHQAPSLLPWLASRIKKGDIQVNFDSWGVPRDLSVQSERDSGLGPRSWFSKVAAWAEARQSPFRQGKNIAEMDASEVIDLANQHYEWVESKKQYEQHKDEIESTEGQKREMDARDLRAAGPEGFPLSAQRVADMPEVIAEINRKIESGELDPEDYSYVLSRVSLDPKDYEGWKVVKVNDTRDAELESAVLGHCMGDQNYGYWHAIDAGAIEAYSLRDANGVPKVSWHYNPEQAYEPGSLAHIQGKSGYPKQDFRDLISLYNIAVGQDDDGGGEGDEYSLEEEYGGRREVDFGLIDDAESLTEILEDPYEYAMRYNGDELNENVEFEGNVDELAIGKEIAENDHLKGWSAEIMGSLMNGPQFGASMEGIIKETLRALEEKWETYYGEEMPPPHEFNLTSIERMYEDDLVDGHLLWFLQAVGAKPETSLSEDSLSQLDIPETFDFMNSRRYPANEYEPDTEDRSWLTDERTRELEEEGVRDRQQPIMERRTPHGVPIEMTPGHQRIWNGGELEQLKPKTPGGYVAPRENPNRIAEEYWRIWQTEGQQAAAEWYYDQFADRMVQMSPGADRPDLDPRTPTVRVPVQLNSSWNDLMRW